MAFRNPFAEDEGDIFLRRLGREISDWVREGIISEDAKSRILGKYGEVYQKRIKVERQGRLTQIISILGAVLIGVGVLLFIASNWQGLPIGIKLFIIFGSIAVSYGAGFWLDAFQYKKVSTALYFLGALIYGAGIALIAQIYNIQAGGGMLFLLWGAGVFASGLALRSELFLSFSSILFTVWTVFQRFGDGRFFFIEPREVYDLHFWYLIPVALLLFLAYRLRHDKLLALQLLGVFTWIDLALSQWKAGAIESIVFYIALGIFLLSAALIHRSIFKLPRDFVLPYSFLGAAFVLVGSYLLSFNQILNQFHNTKTLSGVETPFWVLFGVIALVGFVLAVLLPFLRDFLPFIHYGLLGLAGLLVFSAIFLFYPVDVPQIGGFLYRSTANTFNPYMLVWNVFLAAEILGIILLGYFTHEPRYLNFGLFFFFLQVVSRYFDVFSLYFGTYASFIVGGILFVVLGIFLERFRRRLLKKMGEQRMEAPATL